MKMNDLWILKPSAPNAEYPAGKDFTFCYQSLRDLREVFRGHGLVEEILDKILAGDDLTELESKDLGLLIEERSLTQPVFATYFSWRIPFLLNSGGFRQ